jgi:hypothetical protein
MPRPTLLACAAAAMFPVALPVSSSSSSSSGAGGALSCTGAGELFTGIAFIAGTCCSTQGQGSEDCDQSIGTLFPSSCGTWPCARTVRNVAAACEGLMGNAFFASQRKTINDLAAQCAAVPDPPKLLGGITALAGQTVTDVCGVTITDGKDQEKVGTWKDTVVLKAPVGQTLHVEFVQFWLPDGDTMDVFDGATEGTPSLAHRSGHDATTKLQAVDTSGREALLQVLTDKGNAQKDVGLILRVTCQCTNATSCGVHGRCPAVGATCLCLDGWSGAICDVDPCLDIECGAHGHCSAGTCTCAPGWRGSSCDKSTGCDEAPCNGHGSCMANGPDHTCACDRSET